MLVRVHSAHQVAVGALDFRAGRTLVQAEKRQRMVTIHPHAAFPYQ